jgi:hypothetical protein
MSTQKNKNTVNETVKAPVKEMDADVLYQKLGDRWFAFSMIGDEVFMSPISDEIIQGIKTETSHPRSDSNETI